MLATFVIEFYEGHKITDPSLVADVFIHGLVTPFLSWALITLLAQAVTRSAKNKDQFDRHRQFTQQLTQHQAWSELTRYVTEFPGAILPVVRASLYTYEHQNAKFEFVSEWNANGVVTFGRPFVPEICDVCPLHQLQRSESLTHCHRDADDYCLSLICNNVLVGALQLKRRGGQSFTQDQVNFMTAISPEVALAMALLIAQPRQMDQVRTTAQLDERRRITYDLHDSLAQQIGYLHLALDRLTEDGDIVRSERLRADMERMRSIAGEAYDRVRSNLSILRSQENADLSRAVVDYADTVSKMAHLQIDVAVTGEPTPLSPALSQNVLNLARESLTNVEKHARASRVQIDLLWAKESLHLMLTDDGVGFDPASAPADGHYGLAMITERVKAARGELKIESAPGQGTRLLFKIPLQRPKTDDNRSPLTESNHL